MWEKFEGIYKYLSKSEPITQQSKNNVRNEKSARLLCNGNEDGTISPQMKKERCGSTNSCDKWGSSNENRN